LSGDLKSLHEQGRQRCQAEQQALHEMAARLAQTLDDVKAKTVAVQAGMMENLHTSSSNQQAAMQKVDGMIASLAQQAQTLQARLADVEGSRQAAFQKMLGAIQGEREAAARSTAQQLKDVSRVGTELVSSMNDCRQRFSEDIAKLADAQQKVALHLDRLARSDSFSRKLFGIEEGLSRVAAGLKDVNARIRTEQVVQDSTDGPRGGRRPGLWRRLMKGDGHA